MKIRFLMACVLSIMIAGPITNYAQAKPRASAQKSTSKTPSKPVKKPPKSVLKNQSEYKTKRDGKRISSAQQWEAAKNQVRFQKTKIQERLVTFRNRTWNGQAGTWEPVRPPARE
ncbi:MAG: hypothetical protein DHS20C04_17930 [Hyphococcus sp.]|nr:MAG: hypothetical protein DHS20C04_17930 [Marinicaulis sp.]